MAHFDDVHIAVRNFTTKLQNALDNHEARVRTGLNEDLPQKIIEHLKEGIPVFELMAECFHKIEDFYDGNITAIELIDHLEQYY